MRQWSISNDSYKQMTHKLLQLALIGILSFSCIDSIAQASKRTEAMTSLFGISLGSSMLDGAKETEKFGRLTSQSSLALQRLYSENPASSNKLHAPGWESHTFNIKDGASKYTLELFTDPNGKYWKISYRQDWINQLAPTHDEFVAKIHTRLGKEDFLAQVFGKTASKTPISYLAAWTPQPPRIKLPYLIIRAEDCNKDSMPETERIYCASRALSAYTHFWPDIESRIRDGVTKVELHSDESGKNIRIAKIDVYYVETQRQFSAATTSHERERQAKEEDRQQSERLKSIPKF